MKLSFSRIKDLLLFSKYQSPFNTKKMCFIVGFSNIFTCILFYVWLFITHKQTEETYIFTLVSSLVFLFHVYINLILINWRKSYVESWLSRWVWLSLVFILPFGLGLILSAAVGNHREDTQESSTPKTIFNSFTNSLVHVSENLSKALKYLNENHGGEMREFLRIVELPEDTELWPNKAKFLVIALYQALRSKRKKNTFEDVVFHAHWYDGRRFDFALLDPKGKIMPVKHKYSMAFLILDEVNNYQKILNHKKEIKANIKFGPAKSICLHWGKGFKFYVNA